MVNQNQDFMTHHAMDILIVDDEKSIRLTTSIALESEGHYVETAEDGTLALQRIKEEDFDLVFLELRLGDLDGLDILQKIIAAKPQQLVAMLTAQASIPNAIKATRLGAFDYIEKPFTTDQLRAILTKARKYRQCQSENVRLNPTIQKRKNTSQNTSPPLQFSSEDARTSKEFETLFRAAATSASILILGESGTGKSVIAREIHNRSHLRDEPFVTVSCPSLSKELLESALFGHMKGSFTGAIKDTWGKIHAADGGTLFLDEIGELPLEIQPKLLRLLQEREYERIGENKVREANVRIIAATNCNLLASIQGGDFREDLYYRLNVISVTVPPLRHRPSDLIRFAKDYLHFFSTQIGRNIDDFSDGGRNALLLYPWPGNLRELRNAIERATILACGSKVEAEDLPQPATESFPNSRHDPLDMGIGGEYSLDEIEQAHLIKVLDWAPSLHDAAAVLGIDKATLYRKRKRFGIE